MCEYLNDVTYKVAFNICCRVACQRTPCFN